MFPYTHSTWNVERIEVHRDILLLAFPNGLDDGVGGSVLTFSHQDHPCELHGAFGTIFSFPFVRFFWVVSLDKWFSCFHWKCRIFRCKTYSKIAVIPSTWNEWKNFPFTFHYTVIFNFSSGVCISHHFCFSCCIFYAFFEVIFIYLLIYHDVSSLNWVDYSCYCICFYFGDMFLDIPTNYILNPTL